MSAISIVVPVKNDAARLRRCLDSIRRNRPGGPAVQLIVADNGSTDDSATVATEAGAQVLIRPGLRVSALRNAASRLATGDLIGFIDADHEIVEGWVSAAVDVMRQPQVGATGAKYSTPPNSTWVQRMYGALRGTTSGSQSVEWLGSGNLVVRRDVFERLHGFDEGLEATEDVELCHRILEQGLTIVADQRLASVHHGDPPSLRRLFTAERWRGRDNLRVSLRQPASLKGFATIAIPMVTAAVPLSLVLVVVAIFSGYATARHVIIPLIAAGLVVTAPLAIRILAGLGSRPKVHEIGQAATVAFTYNLARGIAMIARAPHHRG